MVTGFSRRFFRDEPRVKPFNPVRTADIGQKGLQLIMIMDITHYSGNCRSRYEHNSDQRMRKFDISDPQQAGQNDDIRQGITKVVLADYNHERQ
ncbi:hypothetical protein D3C76_1126520 [compost metagenome]